MEHEEAPAPGVSFVIPVFNEVDYIEKAIATVLGQDYPGDKELILALAPSTDGTTELVERLAKGDPRIRTVNNPGADIPVGLNLAIRASTNPIAPSRTVPAPPRPRSSRMIPVTSPVRPGCLRAGPRPAPSPP